MRIQRHDRAKPVAVGLIGAGAHARDIEAIYKRVYPELRLARFDDDATKLNGYIRAVDTWDGRPYFLGVNDPQTKAVLDARLNIDRAADALVDPSAIVGLRCELKPGVVLAPHVTLLADVKLAWHVHVNYGSSMTRTHVGAYTTIAPGVTVCGDVVIGKRVFVGAGVTIRNGVTVGDDAFIRMGKVVTHDVKAGERV